MKYTRVHRLLKIIILINGSAHYNAKSLSEICETSERNVFRDIEQRLARGRIREPGSLARNCTAAVISMAAET